MIEELKKYLYQLLARVEGLHCIVISDRDGVPLVKVTTDQVPELATRPSFLATYTLASDQASKLGLGKNESLICIYSKYQIIQLNKSPLIVSFIANESSNTGLILNLEQYIDPIIQDLSAAVTTES